jgi:hypothetical protein
MPYTLILIIFLMSPIGELPVVQEIRTESEAKCVLLKDYIVKNSEISGALPVTRAEATCQKRQET